MNIKTYLSFKEKKSIICYFREVFNYRYLTDSCNKLIINLKYTYLKNDMIMLRN